MERIGIYGGTFNPVHIGHVRGAKQAAEKLGLSTVLMVPTRVAPHKELPEGSPSPEQRLEMLRLAVADCPEIQVSDVELNLDGPSYTYRTVQLLRQQYPEAELVLIMGTDMFLSFDSWREKDRILSQAELGVLYRGDSGEKKAVQAQKAQLEAAGARVTLAQNEVTAISSTNLRRMVVFGCAEPMLPAGVGAFIREQGLYGVNGNYSGLSMEQLEPVVVRLLNPNRVAHVLGCRDTAVELAKRWGADETDAARAGILHDITKALDGPLQLTLCGEYGKILDDFSTKNPKTLHALTGSLVAERIFGENKAVVDAICSHTTGKANMNTLEKIIYVADYMEPNRSFPGVEKLRELAFSNLDAALKLGLEMTLAMLKEQGRDISPESADALSYLIAQGV